MELVLVLAIVGLATAYLVPPIERWSAAQRMRLAAGELVSVLRQARFTAVRRAVRVGVKFYPGEGSEGRTVFVLYRDGDGDGVLSADIVAGVDPPEQPRRELAALGRRVRFGFPPGVVPRDPGNPRRRLDRLEDPIRFNRSDIASFDPLGTSTPGSLYLTDGYGLVAVRVFGRTGKVKVITYDRDTERWR